MDTLLVKVADTICVRDIVAFVKKVFLRVKQVYTRFKKQIFKKFFPKTNDGRAPPVVNIIFKLRKEITKR